MRHRTWRRIAAGCSGGREGEAPAEPQSRGSAGASPSRTPRPSASRSTDWFETLWKPGDFRGKAAEEKTMATATFTPTREQGPTTGRDWRLPAAGGPSPADEAGTMV